MGCLMVYIILSRQQYSAQLISQVLRIIAKGINKGSQPHTEINGCIHHFPAQKHSLGARNVSKVTQVLSCRESANIEETLSQEVD